LYWRAFPDTIEKEKESVWENKKGKEEAGEGGVGIHE
jgi:hypothetical protein